MSYSPTCVYYSTMILEVLLQLNKFSRCRIANHNPDDILQSFITITTKTKTNNKRVKEIGYNHLEVAVCSRHYCA